MTESSTHEHGWSGEPEPEGARPQRTEELEGFSLPGRPRRSFGGWRVWALIAVIVGAVAFYAGVRVEKGQLASTPSTLAFGRLSATPSGGSGTGGSAAGGAASGGSGAGRFGGGGFRSGGGFAGGLGGGGNAQFGTVSSILGRTVYITEASGATVKVSLPAGTKITKSVSVGKSAIRPGDTVVVQGVKNPQGTVVAASVSDSGARGGALSGSGRGSASSSGNASSAVNSLFGSGGG